MTYPDFFKIATGHPPYPWQERLAMDPECRSRLIDIPTGLGKTTGVVLAWLWNFQSQHENFPELRLGKPQRFGKSNGRSNLGRRSRHPSIQDRFNPEPLFNSTGKGHYGSRTVEDNQEARQGKEKSE